MLYIGIFREFVVPRLEHGILVYVVYNMYQKDFENWSDVKKQTHEAPSVKLYPKTREVWFVRW